MTSFDTDLRITWVYNIPTDTYHLQLDGLHSTEYGDKFTVRLEGSKGSQIPMPSHVVGFAGRFNRAELVWALRRFAQMLEDATPPTTTQLSP